MPPPQRSQLAYDLSGQRTRIMRGLARANAAALLIILITIVLALVGSFVAIRAQNNARAAQAALWEAEIARARAERFSRQPGHREHGLRAVAAAARRKPTFDLRNEAIGLLALMDLGAQAAFWPQPAHTGDPVFDPDVEHCYWPDDHGAVTLHRLSDNREVARLAGPDSPAANVQLSRNGKRLAVRFQNGDVIVWNAELRAGGEAGERLFEANVGKGGGMAVSPDGNVIATVEGKARVRFWRLSKVLVVLSKA